MLPLLDGGCCLPCAEPVLRRLPVPTGGLDNPHRRGAGMTAFTAVTMFAAIVLALYLYVAWAFFGVTP